MKTFSIILIILISSFSSFAESKWKNVEIKRNTLYGVHTFENISEDIIHYNTAYSIEKNQISFGVKPGINLVRMNFNKGYPPNDYSYKQKWRTGFTIGAFMDIPLNNKWAIFQEYNFSKIRGDYLPYEASVKLNYLSIPILARYSFNPRLHLILGFQFDLLISGKQIIDGVTEIITKSTEERNVGLNLGGQYYISKKIFVEVRFMHSLNTIGLWQRNGIKEFKFESLIISGGYIINKKTPR